jgi:hypothetical protein
MTNVSIVGIRGAGKTTSLGLLNQGLTAYALSDKNFEFAPELGGIGYLFDIVYKLRIGDWPEATTEGTKEEVRFNMRFKKSLGRWKEVTIGSYDISGEDIERTLEALKGPKSLPEIIASLRDRKPLAAILNSEVFIFVVDSVICDPGHTRELEEMKARTDLQLAHLCEAVHSYKERNRGKIRALAIIFAKYDQFESMGRLGKVDYYSSDNKNLVMASGKSALRDAKAFEEVVKDYLPATFVIYAHTLKNVNPENLKYFCSGIMMKTDEQTGKKHIALPLEFTAVEYIRLAKWISGMSGQAWF